MSIVRFRTGQWEGRGAVGRGKREKKKKEKKKNKRVLDVPDRGGFRTDLDGSYPTSVAAAGAAAAAAADY